MSKVLDLACDLIARESITPQDAGCQQLIADRLLPQGFEVEWFYAGDVSNVLITHGSGSPSLWFLGHTDVVPPGPLEAWTSAPFQPEVRVDRLYGRGAADMKGSVAAMVVAMERFVGEQPDHRGQVGILLTSDEEGVATHGIRVVANILAKRGAAPDHCLVGEPSSRDALGDTIRIGRRGSIYATLKVHGTQGHTAFPHTIDNPVHRLAPFLAELVERELDAGVEDENGRFPPSHCQVSNIEAGTGAMNVTPAYAKVGISFRNNTHWTSDSLKAAMEGWLEAHGIQDYELDWWVSGEPFRSPAGPLRDALVRSVQEVLQREPRLNTGGGTSDGRFLAPLGTEVVELGLINSTIHQVDEHVLVEDLERLAQVYRHVADSML